MTLVPLHGFGQRYDLPIPLPLYLFAGAAVVVLSFVVVAVFAGDRDPAEATAYSRRRLPALERAIAARWPGFLLGLLGTVTWLAIVVTGIFGSSTSSRNPAEYLLWIYFWAGLLILTALVGNLWEGLNPWAFVHRLTVRTEANPDRGFAGGLPDWLGAWPAVAVYFAFACLELTSGLAPVPAVIGWLALAYFVFIYVGMLAFGREPFLSRVDAFTVLFRLVGMFAPIEVDGQGRAWLRSFGVGLLERWPAGLDRVVFIILTLSTLAFDGLLATPVKAVWTGLFGTASSVVVRTTGLVVLTLLFLAAFWAITAAVLALGRGPDDDDRGFGDAFVAFALTLVPIALVYNAAHNYAYLVVQSQALWPLLSDPLGRGWDLFPALGGYRPSFVLASAAIVWYAQVVLIVAGHVVAVYLAHRRAGERFQSAARVLVSQYPMLLLMVLYTATSLWILAQPITREA